VKGRTVAFNTSRKNRGRSSLPGKITQNQGGKVSQKRPNVKKTPKPKRVSGTRAAPVGDMHSAIANMINRGLKEGTIGPKAPKRVHVDRRTQAQKERDYRLNRSAKLRALDDKR
jgi:hypothetical protein